MLEPRLIQKPLRPAPFANLVGKQTQSPYVRPRKGRAFFAYTWQKHAKSASPAPTVAHNPRAL